MRTSTSLFGGVVVALIAGSASAAVQFQSDFSTFANGNLVGQGGWAQLGASSTNPLQVSNGRAVLPGLGTSNGDGQDALRGFSAVSAADGTSIYAGLTINVNTVLAPNSSTSGSSYVLALQSSDGFANFRVATRQGTTPGTFQFGIRPTGQGGNSFAFGGDLPLNTDLSLVLAWNFVAGVQNDTIAAYINPTSLTQGGNSAYASNTQNNAAGDALGFNGLIFSQFTSASSTQTGATIGRAIVATDFAEAASYVPTPGSAVLLGLGGLVASRRRRA